MSQYMLVQLCTLDSEVNAPVSYETFYSKPLITISVEQTNQKSTSY